MCYYKINIDYRKILEERLKKGIKNNEFVIYLQPKFYTKTGKLAGAEALIRWKQENELVMPNTFIPLFEKYELITILDTYVLESIFSQLSIWQKKGYKLINISVNESRQHLYNEHHIDDLIHLINEYNVSSNYIELEMTETTIVHNVELAKQAEINKRIEQTSRAFTDEEKDRIKHIYRSTGEKRVFLTL